MKTREEQLLDNIAHLLNQIGDRGTCKGCGNTIYWVQHLNGKRTPYTREAGNHFIDCVAAKDFRKAGA